MYEIIKVHIGDRKKQAEQSFEKIYREIAHLAEISRLKIERELAGSNMAKSMQTLNDEKVDKMLDLHAKCAIEQRDIYTRMTTRQHRTTGERLV